MDLRGDEASKGPKDALVTIVEYSEFECPFCKRVNPTIAGLFKKYGDQIRVVWKHNPLPFHKKARGAAMAAEAAKEQGKFWEMHDLLFENQKKLTRPQLDGYAKQLGLNMGKYKAFMDGNKYDKQINADQAAARKLGASGTPAFFINGRNLSGAQPQPRFEAVINQELKRAKAQLAKGTPKSKLYAELIKNGQTKPKFLPGSAKPGGGAGGGANVRKSVKVNVSDPWKGGKNAKVTIVEWSDFQCPFCTRVNPTLKKIHDTYGNKVKVVFKQNPLSFHKDAKPAAKASLAAHEQGKFWEMHDMLFANQKKLKRADLDKYAQELGLNAAKFKAAMDSDKFDKQIAADQAQAAALGARGTPGFFINGRQLKGAQPFARFKTIIDEELAGKGPKAVKKKG
jgi:protein-disulfide isomerase